jgi:hypothetical protein
LDFQAVASGIYLQEVDPMLESQSFYNSRSCFYGEHFD